MTRRTRPARDQLDLWSEGSVAGGGFAVAVQPPDTSATTDGEPAAGPAGALAEAGEAPAEGERRRPELPDAPARARILSALDANLFIEAGAGAGKTTEMVRRMVALIRAGTPVERIAAVTFTRKAASELRERFQTAVERELRRARDEGDDAAADRLDAALRGIDAAFLGTIHSFCARLLRERPLDAGLDPRFREIQPPDDVRILRAFWNSYRERLAASGDAALVELARIGLAPADLYDLFVTLAENADVAFPSSLVAAPDAGPARRALDELLDRANGLMPDREPAGGWDPLQTLIRRLRFHRFILGWDDDIRFLNVLADASTAVTKLMKNRWASDRKGQDAATRFGSEFRDFLAPDGLGGRAAAQWYAHRYPVALAFARRAADEFAAHRRATGQLFFQDLLLLSARLLRESAAARRELGRRYRHVLVDEFQDTDPIQAEVLFLLASDPPPAARTEERWIDATPRPGALFVVGDPKQSIYRFRRADITLYDQVKRRFRSFGEVLELTANFRSRRPIEELVNGVFRGVFPADATPEQAPFAPMRVQQEDGALQGVFTYRIDLPPRSWQETLAEVDADRLASWVAARVGSGERKPGDFLVLTRRKRFLARYARALEARNIPVQVTGAGLGLEAELEELRLLLRALCDPGDPTLTVAVLVGIFFGIDYEQLAAHVLDRGGRFDFVQPSPTLDTLVERALSTLHRFWEWAMRDPADVTVARIVDELGLLPFAAAGDLGESRAGALLYILDAVRKAALAGDASLGGALAAIEAALESEEAEAPLEPGRANVVRLMNLHQAKGLEAPVVILAEPFGRYLRPPELHVVRDAAGEAIGHALVGRKQGYRTEVLAHPHDWDLHADAESRFERAEEDRLRYVAATRAGEELVIGRGPTEAESPWAAFGAWLDRHATRLILPDDLPPDRRHLARTHEDIRAEMKRVQAARLEGARPTYRAAGVRDRVEPAGVSRPGPLTAVGPDLRASAGDPHGTTHSRLAVRRGTEWGKAVHGTLEAAGRGASGEALRAVARSLLVAAEAVDDARGAADVDLLVGTVEAVTRSPVWQRALRAHHRLIEVPFAVSLPLAAYRALVPAAPDEAPLQIVEGVIDLAFRDDDGWTVVDYKSDAGGLGIDPDLRSRYRAQVELYAAAWTRLTGAPVHTRAILFTATDQLDSF